MRVTVIMGFGSSAHRRQGRAIGRREANVGSRGCQTPGAEGQGSLDWRPPFSRGVLAGVLPSRRSRAPMSPARVRRHPVRHQGSFALSPVPLACALGLLAVLGPEVHGQPAFDVKAAYEKREVMIPMRDGTRLFTIIYSPRDPSAALPYPAHPHGVRHPALWARRLPCGDRSQQ